MTPRVGDSFNGIKVLKMSSEGGVCTIAHLLSFGLIVIIEVIGGKSD